MRNPTVRDDLFYDRLAAWIESRRHIPFAWAANDCITCAASWVEAATGDTPLPALLEYHTADEAAALLAERGGLEKAVAEAMEVAGFQPCGTGHAARGDVVLARHSGVVAVGVCIGAEVVVPGPDGLQFIPRGTIVRAWAI